MRLAVLCAALLCAVPADARVLDLHSEIRVAKSGELTVTERITEETRKDGHPDRRTRQVTYRAARRIAFLADHDALHWNLKGGERMTAEVILPASVPARQIRVEVVASAPSAQGGEVQSFVSDGRAAFRSQQPIALVVRFPKGVVAEPGLGEHAGWFFSDYFGPLVVAALLAFTALVLHLIRGQGRNSLT
jgi:hypothetical protein